MAQERVIITARLGELRMQAQCPLQTHPGRSPLAGLRAIRQRTRGGQNRNFDLFPPRGAAAVARGRN